MRTTQAVLSASFVLAALADTDVNLSSQCNLGSTNIACNDEIIARDEVHPYDYSFQFGDTVMKIVTFRSATVWLTRAASS
jgi:hypothetical protein